MFWIDIVLIIFYILIVFICGKRGLIRTILTFSKILLSFFIASSLQKNIGTYISNLLPLNIDQHIEGINNFLPINVLNYLKSQTTSITSTFIAFLIIFVLTYIFSTIIGNIINNLVSKNLTSNFINKMGGLILGIFLGIILVAIFSFIIGLSLFIYNPTIAIATIYKSFFLKLFVADSINFVFENTVKQIPFLSKFAFNFK